MAKKVMLPDHKEIALSEAASQDILIALAFFCDDEFYDEENLMKILNELGFRGML